MSLLHRDVYRLYFTQEKTQREIAKELRISRTRIIAMFRERGWESRPAKRRRKEANPEHVYQLYFDERKTQREIAKELGISKYTISMIFKENEWEFRPAAPRREEVDPDDVYKLYFQEGLSQGKVAEKLGLRSTSPIERVFKENDWVSRGRWGKGSARTHYSSDEERKVARKESSDRRQQELKEMREKLFGTECKISRKLSV